MPAQGADGKPQAASPDLDFKPNGYVDHGTGTDEDTGHGRRRFEGQSIHGDTVSANNEKKTIGCLHWSLPAVNYASIMCNLNNWCHIESTCLICISLIPRHAGCQKTSNHRIALLCQRRRRPSLPTHCSYLESHCFRPHMLRL